MMLVYFILQP